LVGGNPKGLAQVVKVLDLVASPSGLRFEFSKVQTIIGHARSEVESYQIYVGSIARVRDLSFRGEYTKWPYLEKFFIIKKKKKKKKKKKRKKERKKENDDLPL
jgi:hypothetical protein